MSATIPHRALGLTLGLLFALPGVPGEAPAALQVTLQEHRFTPAEVHVKSGQPTFLEVTNLDSTPEEFEMLQLAIEKVIPGGTRARIRIRPLGPGRYAFRGEFHQDLAQGTLISE
jgi:hypothetical protein